MSEKTKQSALFGILSVVLWGLMAIPMFVGIAHVDFNSQVGSLLGIVLNVFLTVIGSPIVPPMLAQSDFCRIPDLANLV